MNFFGKKKTRASQSTLLRPRRSRIFRGAVRENVEVALLRKHSLWTVCYAFLWVAFCSAVVFALFFSSFLRINRKDIAPMKSVAESEVVSIMNTFLSGKFFGILPRDTILIAFLRRHILEEKLLEFFPIFRSVQVSFVFPGTIVFEGEEREKTLVLCSGGPCFLVDERGFAFTGALTPIGIRDADAILSIIDRSANPVASGDPVFSETVVRAFSSLRQKLQSELGIETSSIAETPSRLSDEVWFQTGDGWELRMSSAVPSEKAFLALRLLFDKTLSEGDRKRLDYIDLRTENRIFYLLKGEEQKEGEKTGDDEKQEGKKKKKE